MARQLANGFGTIVSVVIMGWVPVLCLAQEEKPTIDRILQVWKERQEKVATARFELDCEETIHKGSTSYMDAPRRRRSGLPPEKEPNPPRDYLVEGKSSISLGGQKLRYAYDHQKWDPIVKKLYLEHYVDVFDGQLFKFLQIPASGQKDYPLAAVRKVAVSQSTLNFPILPIFLTVRGNHNRFFHKLEQFQISDQSVVVNKRPCLELVLVSTSFNRREVLYLDTERDYVVVRESILVNNHPDWQLDIVYAPEAIIGWMPQSWEYVIGRGKDNRTLHSGRSKVTHYEINPSFADNEFDILFPAKTRVDDHSSGKYVEYIIKEDGNHGREIPAAHNPTYEDLQKAGTRLSRRVMLAVWAAILVLTLGGWFWLRWRRARRNS